MTLKDYFETTKGLGVLGTADVQGNVDLAVYSRPHVMDDGTLAFIMADRLTHKNIQSNPKAAFLFVEEGGGYKGKRLFLTMVREDDNRELIDTLSRKKYDDPDKKKYLVYFTLEKELPLIGD